MKNVDQGDAVTRQKARKTSCADCNSRPLLKAGNAWWHVANVEQSQKSTQCSNQPGQLSFWHSLTWFLWSKALYVMPQVSHPSKHCSSWTRSSLRWPSLRRNLPDAALVSTIKPYQMVWEGRSLLLCDAQHLQRGKWITKRSCRQITCSIRLNEACEGVRRMKSAEQNHEDITEP